jgi:hypothetical protein
VAVFHLAGRLPGEVARPAFSQDFRREHFMPSRGKHTYWVIFSGEARWECTKPTLYEAVHAVVLQHRAHPHVQEFLAGERLCQCRLKNCSSEGSEYLCQGDFAYWHELIAETHSVKMAWPTPAPATV